MLPAPSLDIAAYAGVENLRQRAAANDPGALEEAATQFEAMIINLMLKSARDAMPADGAFDGTDTQQYLELMDQHVSLALARQGSLGLAKLLTGEAERPRVADVAAAPGPRPPANPEGFVAQILPHARSAAAALGVDAKLLVAQAALETGWGSAMPSRPDGAPSFNLFGIKADGGWQGDTVAQQTLEFAGGVAQRGWAKFRAYSSLADSFADYVHLIRAGTPYRDGAAGADSPEAYVDALTRGGYATDPDYGNKWLAVYRGDRLRDAYAGAL